MASVSAVERSASQVAFRCGRNTSMTRSASTRNRACATQKERKILRNRLFMTLHLHLFPGLLPGTGKDVADAPDRLDMLIGVSIAEFLADFADVHVDAAVEGRE